MELLSSSSHFAIYGPEQIQQAIELSCALRNSDYSGFFGIVKRADYLVACLAHLYFEAVQAWALRLLTQRGSKGFMTMSELADMVW